MYTNQPTLPRCRFKMSTATQDRKTTFISFAEKHPSSLVREIKTFKICNVYVRRKNNKVTGILFPFVWSVISLDLCIVYVNSVCVANQRYVAARVSFLCVEKHCVFFVEEHDIGVRKISCNDCLEGARL